MTTEIKEWPSGAIISEPADWETYAESRAARVTMPAGEYWVGDPCYAVPDDLWSDWLDEAYGGKDGNHVSVLLADIRGMAVLGIGTEHGDGVYEDQLGYDYPVDAGLIGLVPTGLYEGDEAPFGMYLHEWSEPFECRYVEAGGTIVLGGICIKTDPEEDYYSEEYDGDLV